jgi:D-amino peptidase
MKVYIMTDMEGISLAYYWEQVKGGEPFYPRYQKILTMETNAAIEGAFMAGASEVVVNDGHGGGGREYNLIWEDLDQRAIIEKPDSAANIMPSLNESFEAFLLVGYHAMSGTPMSVMPHTQNSKKWQSFRLNDRECGELSQMALIAGEFGVPVAYVSGDRAAVAEAKTFFGDDLPATIVKEAHANGRITSLNPRESARRIRRDVEKALKQPKRKPYYFPGPYRMEIEFKSKEYADELNGNPKMTRVNDTTVAFSSERASNMLEL